MRWTYREFIMNTRRDQIKPNRIEHRRRRGVHGVRIPAPDAFNRCRRRLFLLRLPDPLRGRAPNPES